MFQLSFVDEKSHPELADEISRIKADRGGRYGPPYNLFMHSPAIATAWLALLKAVRWETALDGKTRELVIIRIAILTHGEHERKVHESVYAPKEGLTQEQIAAIERWRESKAFSAAQSAALAYTDAMTTDVQVSERMKEELQRHYSERQIIELTVLIGAYNMHSRVSEALDIEQRTHGASG